MGLSSSDGTPAYKNASLGLWAMALAIQISGGGVLFFTGYRWGGYEDIVEVKNINLSDGWKVLEVLGVCEVIMGALVAVAVLTGFFISRCFMGLLWIASVVNCIYCVAVAGTCGYYMHLGAGMKKNTFEHYWDADVAMPTWTDPNFKLYRDCSGRLLLGAALSLAALAPYSRASFVRDSDPPSESFLYVTSVMIALVMGVVLAMPTDLKPYIILGSVWIGFTVAVGTLNNILALCSKRGAFGLLGVLFVCISAYAFVTLVILGLWYENGRTLTNKTFPNDDEVRVSYQEYHKVDTVTGEHDRSLFLKYNLMDQGNFMLVVIILSCSQFVVSLFSSFYSLRAACAEED